jgi:hypothetical protein
VDATVARRLRPADVADLVEHLTHEPRDALRVRELGSRLRVDVDPQLVRMLDVATARRPGMEVERREIDRPDHVRELGDAQLVGVAAGREGDARRLDPVRPLLGHALLVDRLALGAVRVPLQLRRPLVEGPDDAVADRHVVLGEVELRLAAGREEDLVGVRDLDGPRADLELDEGRRHPETLDDAASHRALDSP